MTILIALLVLTCLIFMVHAWRASLIVFGFLGGLLLIGHYTSPSSQTTTKQPVCERVGAHGMICR